MDSLDKAFTLTPGALDIYDRVQDEAVVSVAAAFYAELGPEAAHFDAAGRKACQTDIRFHLEFLRPVLETGLLQPYVDYLKWLSDVFVARNISCDHIGLILTLIGDYFSRQIPGEGRVVSHALTSAFEQSIDLGPDHLVPSALGISRRRSIFCDALFKGDRAAASAILDACEQSGESLAETYVNLVQASLYDIGRKWQHNEISVAMEHLASMTVQSLMAERLARLPVPAPRGRKAILACVEGNNHELGLRMVAHGLESGGWQVQCLGGSTPTSSLIEQIRQFQPHLVGLSVALPTHFVPARKAVAAIRKTFGADSPRVMVGGGAINRYPQLAEFIGADRHIANLVGLGQCDIAQAGGSQ